MKCKHKFKIDEALIIWAIALGTIETMMLICSKCGAQRKCLNNSLINT